MSRKRKNVSQIPVNDHESKRSRVENEELSEESDASIESNGDYVCYL